MDKYELESSQYYNKNFNNFSIIIIFPSIILLLILLFLFLFSPHESVLKLKGQIEPISAVETIKMDIGLKPKQKYYFEGQKVKQGQVLALCEKPKNRIVKMKAKRSGLVHVDFLKKAKQINEIIKIYPKLGVNKNVRIIAYVPSNNINIVKRGQKMILTVKQSESLTTAISGRINTVGTKPVTIRNKNFYLVEAQTKLLAKQAKMIRYGMKGDASLLIKKENSLVYFINQLFRRN